MGVFSGARSEGVRSHQHPVIVRSKRVRATEGVVRDPWLAIPEAREAAESPFDPVRGVSLEMFADIAKAVESRDDADLHARDLALGMGIEPNDWRLACRTWNLRISTDPAVAQQFTMRFRDEVPSFI
jgi:hypothetical protein